MFQMSIPRFSDLKFLNYGVLSSGFNLGLNPPTTPYCFFSLIIIVTFTKHLLCVLGIVYLSFLILITTLCDNYFNLPLIGKEIEV